MVSHISLVLFHIFLFPFISSTPKWWARNSMSHITVFFYSKLTSSIVTFSLQANMGSRRFHGEVLFSLRNILRSTCLWAANGCLRFTGWLQWPKACRTLDRHLDGGVLRRHQERFSLSHWCHWCSSKVLYLYLWYRFTTLTDTVFHDFLMAGEIQYEKRNEHDHTNSLLVIVWYFDGVGFPP